MELSTELGFSNRIKALNDALERIQSSIDTDRTLRKKDVVFMPWSSEKWGAMESIWKAVSEDPDYNAVVLPILWYYRDALGKPITEEPQYDLTSFPEYVHVTSFKEYNFFKRGPKIIFIQNPNDSHNYATISDPALFSGNLRKMTENLIYIPWFLTDEIDLELPKDKPCLFNMRYYVNMPGVARADMVVVQSEQMRKAYIETLVKFAGEDTRPAWEKKIYGFGSPLMELAKEPGYENIPVSKIWEQIKAVIEEG